MLMRLAALVLFCVSFLGAHEPPAADSSQNPTTHLKIKHSAGSAFGAAMLERLRPNEQRRLKSYLNNMATTPLEATEGAIKRDDGAVEYHFSTNTVVVNPHISTVCFLKKEARKRNSTSILEGSIQDCKSALKDASPRADTPYRSP